MVKFQWILFSSIWICLTCHGKQLWSDNSFTWLKGHHYKVGDADRRVLTFEHASGHDWGDVFLFVDRISAEQSHQIYAEFSPRFKLPVGFNSGANSLFHSAYIAYTLEASESSNVSFDNHLLGLSVNLNVPGFKYFKLTFFRRFNEEMADSWQLTHVFAAHFRVGKARFLYDGFTDWVSANEDKYSTLNCTTQLKWDAGDAIFKSPGNLYIGVEYTYWRNKFGIRNSDQLATNESNTNLLLKVHF